jgi:hypothetical protein
MNNLLKATLCSAVLAVFTLPVIAQSATPSTPPASTATPSATAPSSSAPAPSTATAPSSTTTPPTVNQRAKDQQNRISQGVSSGQLTAGESSNLEKKESELNQEKTDMRKEDDGHLTAADKAALNQQQNQLSNQIYKDKHNSAVQGNQGYESEVGGRAQNQQSRIAQGVNSGQLNAGQTSHLENQEAGINKEIRTDKAANGGQLTPAQRAQINKQQTQLSHQIHKDKHTPKK